MPVRKPSLSKIADLIVAGQVESKEAWDKRFDELKADFDEKHKENRERRHAQGGQIERVDNAVHNLESRVVALEQSVRSIVGDNTGASGLLHDIDKKVDSLSSEMAGIKKVLIFLGVLIPIVLGVLAIIYKH